MSDVIANSPPFVAFYHTECGNISGDIRWCLWPDMPSNYGALSAPPNYILLREVPVKEVPSKGIPPPPDQAFMIAHELAGFLLSARGYPSVGSSNPAAAEVVPGLEDIAWDAKRDSLLEQYGFPLISRYSELANIASSGLNHDLDTVNPGNITNLVVLLNYLRAEVYWQYALGHNGWASTDLYKQVHGNQIPSWFAEKADGLSTIIGNESLDTPQQMYDMFNAIITDCGIQSYIVITFNPP